MKNFIVCLVVVTAYVTTLALANPSDDFYLKRHGLLQNQTQTAKIDTKENSLSKYIAYWQEELAKLVPSDSVFSQQPPETFNAVTKTSLDSEVIKDDSSLAFATLPAKIDNKEDSFSRYIAYWKNEVKKLITTNWFLE